jgi:hypothetical protein
MKEIFFVQFMIIGKKDDMYGLSNEGVIYKYRKNFFKKSGWYKINNFEIEKCLTTQVQKIVNI